MRPAVPPSCLGMCIHTGHRPAWARSVASIRLPGSPGPAAPFGAKRAGWPRR
jgi:hypothetical protein